jgi:hypothetical protein
VPAVPPLASKILFFKSASSSVNRENIFNEELRRTTMLTAVRIGHSGPARVVLHGGAGEAGSPTGAPVR